MHIYGSKKSDASSCVYGCCGHVLRPRKSRGNRIRVISYVGRANRAAHVKIARKRARRVNFNEGWI